ncbi:MAG: mannosyl-glycoprotein endo-beta-N-acetylglucosamidase [Nitrospirae bacterium]|nr:MAG: mannosyl-glycoprotein endo-beta-N-acetylglucosamidase [Nitrospirota bacterium]
MFGLTLKTLMKNLVLIGVALVSSGLIIDGASKIHFRPEFTVKYTLKEEVSLKELIETKIDCNAVKPVVYKKFPDLRGLHPSVRKEVFIKLLLPPVLIAQKNIELQRALLLKLEKKTTAGIPLSQDEKDFIERMIKRYKARTLKGLLFKFRPHPISLVIAQAAIESGWGTSRFAREANNLFGIWQFNGKRGIKAKDSDAKLRVYKTIMGSIEDYLYNLNAGWAYKEYRKARLQTKNPLVLIEHLSTYSILREEYTERLKDVINHNKLHRYDRCRIEE